MSAFFFVLHSLTSALTRNTSDFSCTRECCIWTVIREPRKGLTKIQCWPRGLLSSWACPPECSVHRSPGSVPVFLFLLHTSAECLHSLGVEVEAMLLRIQVATFPLSIFILWDGSQELPVSCWDTVTKVKYCWMVYWARRRLSSPRTESFPLSQVNSTSLPSYPPGKWKRALVSARILQTQLVWEMLQSERELYPDGIKPTGVRHAKVG